MTAEPSTNLQESSAALDAGGGTAWTSVCRLLAWFPFLLLFLPYPVAILVPVRAGVPFTYEWALPVFLTASVFCIVGLLSVTGPVSPRLRHAKWLLVLASLVLPLLSAVTAERFDLRETIKLSGMIAIPLYFALCKPHLLPKNLPLVFALLFGVHAVHGLWQIAVGFQVIGVTGNRNWMAALTVSLAPWIPIAAERFMCKRKTLRRWLYPPLIIGTVILAAVLLWHTRCRATVLAILAFGLWWIFWTLPSVRWRVFFTTGAAAVLLALVWLNADTLRAVADKDIRLPCWQGSAAMISDSPWLGTGPGQYRREFPVYRTKAQKNRRVAADITEHPHNQLFFLAATGGIPFALLWLPLLLPLLAPPLPNKECRALHFMTFMLLAHAMLDKQMAQPPTNLLACIGLGLLWRPRLFRFAAVPGKSTRQPHAGALRQALPLLAVLPCLFLMLQIDLPAGTARRRARMAERKGEFRRSVREYVRAAHLTRDARDYLLAGTAASQHLNQPLLSIKLLTWAFQEEPYIGHLNRYAGLTMGRMGQHSLALEHFELEAQLYPFDAAGHQLLYNARIHNGQFKGLPGLEDTIGRLRYRQVVNTYGEKPVHRALNAWWQRVQATKPRQAARIAHWLVEPLKADMLEPIPRFLQTPPSSFQPSAAGAVTRQDFALWQRWARGEDRKHSHANQVPVTPAEFRCRNQALAQLAAHGLPAFPMVSSPSPAARLETAFQDSGTVPTLQYKRPKPAGPPNAR